MSIALSSGLSPSRLVFLDGLRVLAILLVVILHATAPLLTNPQWLGQPLWYLCLLQNPINRAGVPLFLMISGFLFLRTPTVSAPLSFYRRRLPRLLLSLVVWNGVYLLVQTPPSSLSSGFFDYFRTLFTGGSCYHMWFLYAILGIYLLVPVLKALSRYGSRAHMVSLLAVAVFPSSILPLANSLLPFEAAVYLPMVEGLLGYFILGFLLGTSKLSRRAQIGVYLGGMAGYCIDLWADLTTATLQSIPLPSQSGYRISHYFVAAALFVGMRTLFQKRPQIEQYAAAPLAHLSRLSFGVFRVHPLLLKITGRLLETGLIAGPALLVQLTVTVLLSYLLAAVSARLPLARLLL